VARPGKQLVCPPPLLSASSNSTANTTASNTTTGGVTDPWPSTAEDCATICTTHPSCGAYVYGNLTTFNSSSSTCEGCCTILARPIGDDCEAVEAQGATTYVKLPGSDTATGEGKVRMQTLLLNGRRLGTLLCVACVMALVCRPSEPSY
jgi:hypothetical protein